jgi:hypothetical protein
MYTRQKYWRADRNIKSGRHWLVWRVCVCVCVCVCAYKKCQLCCQSSNHKQITTVLTTNNSQLKPRRTVPLSHTPLSQATGWPHNFPGRSLPHSVPLPVTVQQQLITVPCPTVTAQLTAQCSKRHSRKTVTSLLVGQFGVSIAVRIRNLSLFRNVRSGSGPHAASIKGVLGTLYRG